MKFGSLIIWDNNYVMNKRKIDDRELWENEAASYYLDNHTMSETLTFINKSFKVSDRALRQMLKDRNINRGISGAQTLKRFECFCMMCKSNFVGRTPTSVMCDGCVGSNSIGATKERLKRYAYLRRIMSYGIDVNEYEKLLKNQSGKCGLCKKKMKQPCIDHDHETAEVRGLLCHQCNLTLGHIERRGKIKWLKNAEIWIRRT